MYGIQEAFERLNLLDEEYFNLNEDAAEDELDDFVKSDMEMADTADDDIEVIDMDAETEDDLDDNDHIDEIVLECPACHTKIFKQREEIEGADDSNPDALVNIGEECPQCDQTDGFKIYCQCEPYVPSDVEVEIDGEEVDIDYEDDDEGLEESLTEGKHCCGKKNCKHGKCKGKCHGKDCEEIEEAFDLDDDEDYYGGASIEELMDADYIFDPHEFKGRNKQDPNVHYGDDFDPLEDNNDEYARRYRRPRIESLKESRDGIDAEYIDDRFPEDDWRRYAKQDVKVKQREQSLDAMDSAARTKAAKAKALARMQDPNKFLDDDEDGRYYESKKVYRVKNPLHEQFDEVTVKGDGEELEMFQDPETQEITVKSRPRQAVPGEAMVGDIDDADLADMTGTEFEDEEMMPEDSEMMPEDEFTGEEGLGDEEMLPPEEEEDYTDVDIEDIDEDRLDRAVESYFRRTYDNVDSYKTSNIKLINESLLIEGELAFTSGSTKTTSFLMEAGSINTKNGKLSLVGSNQQITPGKKAFSIAGKMKGNKFICESFRYNYAVKDNRGISRRINGTTYAK